MSVGRMEGNTVISVPAVQHRLDLVGRNRGDNRPRRLGVMCLTRSMFVETGVVNHSPGRPVSLWSYHHATAPGDGIVDWNFLKDAEPDIPIKAVLDRLLPMKGNLTR